VLRGSLAVLREDVGSARLVAVGALLPFAGGPCREFAPAGDLLSGPPEVGKTAPVPPPLAARGFPAMLEARGRAELTSLRSVQTSVASQFLKRAAHAPRAPALLGGSKGEAGTANSRIPKQRAGLTTGSLLLGYERQRRS
jgi:hypothetical protein